MIDASPVLKHRLNRLDFQASRQHDREPERSHTPIHPPDHMMRPPLFAAIVGEDVPDQAEGFASLP